MTDTPTSLPPRALSSATEDRQETAREWIARFLAHISPYQKRYCCVVCEAMLLERDSETRRAAAADWLEAKAADLGKSVIADDPWNWWADWLRNEAAAIRAAASASEATEASPASTAKEP